MRAPFVAALILAATVACGAYSFPGQSSHTGHVTGAVTVYPCAPVEQQGVPCKGLFGAGLEIVFLNGSESTSVTVDQSGHYATDLDAGTWKVTFKGIARIIKGPNPVTVPAGGSIVADYVVDSGIRAPAPVAAS
jgi:hypothetical protein